MKPILLLILLLCTSFAFTAKAVPSSYPNVLTACRGTNDSIILNSAIALGGDVVIPKGTVCAADSTVTFTPLVTLHVENGGLLKAITGQTPTFSGPLNIGAYPAFSNIGLGQGSLSFSGNRSLTSMSPLWFGLDCSGVGDNSPIWMQILSFTGDDSVFILPQGCVDRHNSTVTVSSRASFALRSEDRAQNGGGNRRPEELWTGNSGGMWYFQANQAPTIEGFLFTNTTNVDYYLNFDGNPTTRIGTEALVRYNTFTSNTNNTNFTAISINTVSGQNHEKNVITDNDFFCSQARAFRESDSGQIVTGSQTLSCGLGNCAYTTDAVVGDRIRISYASGILDTTVASITDDNHLEMAATASSTQNNARIHFKEAFGNGITIGSVNAKHNTLERDSFTQCARGLNVVNGSFSAAHFGGSANDVLAYIGNVSESSELAYLEDENALRDVYVNNIDAPLVISHARNSIYNAESDGFFFFAKSARVTISSSTIQSTPTANSVLLRAQNPYTVVLLSIGNLWAPGAVTKSTLGFNQWDGVNNPQGALISCGDFGMTDDNGNWTLPLTCGVGAP